MRSPEPGARVAEAGREQEAPPGAAAPHSTSGFGGSLGLLRERSFFWLLLSNSAFFLAMSGQMISRSILAFDLTGDAAGLSFINVSVALPMLLFSPLGGALADRLERRGLVAAAQTLLVTSEVAILVLYLSGLLEFWHLLVGATVIGSVFPFSMPARQAITVAVVGHGRILQAMALTTGVLNASRIVGPLLVGLAIPLIGLGGALAAGVGLYIAALLCILRVERSQPPLAALRPVLRDMKDGFAYVFRERSVTALLFYSILPLLVLMPLQPFLIIFARDVWGNVPLLFGATGSPELGFGLLQAMVGIGGVASSLWLAALGETPRRQRPMLLSLIGFALFLIAFCWMPWFWAALPLLLVAGMLHNAFATLNSSTVHALIPDRVRGRVSSFMMMSFGVTPLAALPLAQAIDAFGAPIAVSSAALLLLVFGCSFALWSRSLRQLDDTLREARS